MKREEIKKKREESQKLNSFKHDWKNSWRQPISRTLKYTNNIKGNVYNIGYNQSDHYITKIRDKNGANVMQFIEN